MGVIIIATSEVLRFNSIQNYILGIGNNSLILYWNAPADARNTIDIRNIVTNWQSRSQVIIKIINDIKDTLNDLNDNTRQQISDHISIIPITSLSELIRASGLRIILGRILMPDLSCPSTSKSKRDMDKSQKIKNKYCSFLINSEFYNILKNKQITSVKILTENTKGVNLKSGTIYVGTNNGIYLIYPGVINFINLMV